VQTRTTRLPEQEIRKREENEAFAFAFLALLAGETLPRNIENQPPPEPDVALVGNRTIGLEITRVHTDVTLKPIEAVQDRIVYRACEIYTGLNQPPVSVRCAWFGAPPHPKPLHESFANTFAQWVSSNIPAFGKWHTYDSCELPDPCLPEGVDYVTIDRMVQYERSHWSNVRSGFVPEVSLVSLVERISAKNTKPTQYKRHYDELILLLVLEGRGQSSFGSTSPKILDACYKSAFDRIFLINFLEMKLSELQRGAP